MNSGKTIKYINGGWVIQNFGNVRELFWWWHSNYNVVGWAKTPIFMIQFSFSMIQSI